MDVVKVSPGAGFFTVDRRTWKVLCGREDIKMIAAYLTICAGTGRGNRVSRWSAEAIHTYSGLAWPRAKEAVSNLIAGAFLHVTDDSPRTRPAYEVQPFAVVLHAAQQSLSGSDHYVINAVRRNDKLGKSTRKDAERLVMRGLLWQRGTGFTVEPPTLEVGDETIWLPNTLVTGTSKGEPSPLKRLRQRWNVDALRLLIDLYHAQALASDGGVSRKVMHRCYERKPYGTYGCHVVWGFTRGEANAYSGQRCSEFFWQRKQVAADDKIGLWEALTALLHLGLLVEVPHLVESSKADCELLHGCAWDGSGEPLEQAIAKAAHAAGRRMLAEPYVNRANHSEMLVPVLVTLADVQMVGIYRLRYRPQTAATSEWLRELQESAKSWVKTYGEFAGNFARVEASR
jgi:hypothetical protein